MESILQARKKQRIKTRWYSGKIFLQNPNVLPYWQKENGALKPT